MDADALTQVKARQQATWASGDFSVVASTINIVGELLCESVDLRAGERVLDVATGSGNTALAAARRFTAVTGVDYVPSLIERAKVRAEAEGLPAEFLVGDAEDLPVPDASFDVVLSTFGVMFAPNQPKAAAEMLRVLRPGGRIGLSNWVPDGFVGTMFRTTSKHVPPPPGLLPPVRWGTEDHVRELFPAAKIELIPRTVNVRFPSVDFWVDYFRTYFGPTVKAFEFVGPEGSGALEADLRAIVTEANVSGDDTVVLPQQYVDVLIRP
ncbi:MAG TPA: class I SAM-dependent methyltransferase [Sporichthya sp.]|nr:class I SAM-dependent methyltransferase [Sporichthya sp.]